MARFYIVGFVLLAACDTLGQTGFKLTGSASMPLTFDLEWLLRVVRSGWLYLAISGYLGSFVTWMTLLKRAPIGPAFAASHLEIVTTLVVAVTVLGETLSARQILGAALVVAGILVLGAEESRRADRRPDGDEGLSGRTVETQPPAP